MRRCTMGIRDDGRLPCEVRRDHERAVVECLGT